MEDKKKSERLAIPVNAPDRNDYVQGFGNKELGIAAGVTLFGMIIFFCAMAQSTDYIFQSFFAVLGMVLLTLLLIVRDKYNETMIDKVRNIIRYHTAQKRYQYEYHDFYEVEDGTEEPSNENNSK